eukprot:1133671-Pelagomonas_calceolata.AAC.17
MMPLCLSRPPTGSELQQGGSAEDKEEDPSVAASPPKHKPPKRPALGHPADGRRPAEPSQVVAHAIFVAAVLEGCMLHPPCIFPGHALFSLLTTLTKCRRVRASCV